ncbi:amino acid adenylation domain-containing protein [Butyrivibrio sp. AD3002]|uniref:amino acid adenylation domain-containing protein n=1 Tax=Butyrivibrio sp. AD3002 TaxID=1280670 RepID=UPI0003B69FF1|nr:amino acid adenylation domain-containing protein [Butyrivibrio sp. AD3002]
MRKMTVLDYLEETTARLPDKTAVIIEDKTYSYNNLLSTAKIVATSIIHECKSIRRKPIMLFMDKGFECLASMYGVIFSGNAYVPMDIKTPIERLDNILDTMNSDIIITTIREKQILDKIGYTGDVLIFEELITKYNGRIEAGELSIIRKSIIDTDIMYILFTSGSTGIPKGVAIMHRSVMDYIDAFINDTPICENDVVGNQTPFYADMSLKDTYMSVAVGATICIIPQKYFMTPKKLLTYIDDNDVTMIMWVPTAYRLVSQFDGLSKVRPGKLHKFVFSGEAMPIPVFKYWTSYYHIAECEYIQQYGPTEITGACTSYHIAEEYEDTDTIPIGKPFKNTGILLINEAGNIIQEPGVLGEICVYGTCLAAGYYNNKVKTDEYFVQNPAISEYTSLMYKTGDLAKYDENENLVFVSRKDYQIKHGGKRIELGEIEAAAMGVNGIDGCCCIHNREDDSLLLFYVGSKEEKMIKNELGKKIPKYMIPTEYRLLDQLPMLPNGKMDRKLLDNMVNQ